MDNAPKVTITIHPAPSAPLNPLAMLCSYRCSGWPLCPCGRIVNPANPPR